MTIEFTVLGLPQPAGSKRAMPIRRKGGAFVTRANGSPMIAVVDDNPKSKDWKNSVRDKAYESMRGVAMLEGPLRVVLRFFRPRPKGHFNSKGELNKHGREMTDPITKPDALKLARGVEDAMTGIVYRDDAQTCSLLIEKDWGEPARVEVVVEPRPSKSPTNEKRTPTPLFVEPEPSAPL